MYYCSWIYFVFYFQAVFLTEGLPDDDSDAVTVHDALSEDEDVLIEDLEIDETFARKQNRNDEDTEDFSLG
jgi:hypothetical protein